jgi:hypothetical protein
LTKRAGAAPAAREQHDPEPNLTEDDRIDSDLALAVAEPLDHPRIRVGLGDLRQDVRVDQMAPTLFCTGD